MGICGMYSKAIKKLGKNRSEENLDVLLKLFEDYRLPIEIRREIVSSIGRQNNNDKILQFINDHVYNNEPMDLVYQMFRTCLIKSKNDARFKDLGEQIRNYFNNEILEEMVRSDQFKYKRDQAKSKEKITDPMLLEGDCAETLKNLPSKSIQLIFTSPPYYNAKEYSNFKSYEDYLHAMGIVLRECHRVLEDGRYILINVSPVITKRPGRNFKSKRYPIPYDFHQISTKAGFEFIDEIMWIKPEPSVPNRIGGYLQTRKPLAYKPNCITESIMVYRKDVPFLIDKNQEQYSTFSKFENCTVDTSNCWYIAPSRDKKHPAVFPEELCEKVLRYYSFEKDVVLDCFAGSGTLGRVALRMNRLPVLCEQKEEYIILSCF